MSGQWKGWEGETLSYLKSSLSLRCPLNRDGTVHCSWVLGDLSDKGSSWVSVSPDVLGGAIPAALAPVR